MDLTQYDCKMVRLTTKYDGLVYEGESSYLPVEFVVHEIGGTEEALQIDHWVFYASDIEDVIILDQDEPSVWMSKKLHLMMLNEEPFIKIEKELKTIELRLYDEKRQKIKVGDAIRFEMINDDFEVIFVEVIGLSIFDSFATLYENLDLRACGYSEDELASASPDDMLKYYTLERQKAYGVVGIHIKLL